MANKGGRPRVDNPRRRTIGASLSDAEYALVSAKIASSNLSKSEAVRMLLLSEKLPQKIFGGLSKEAAGIYQNLQPLQSNLNQFMHAVNSGKIQGISRDEMIKIGQIIKRVEQQVKSLRHEILTVSGGTYDYQSGRRDAGKDNVGHQKSSGAASRPAPSKVFDARS